MRRELRAVGPLLLVTTIALLMVPAAHAGSPWKVGGGWFEMSIPDQMESWVRRNIIVMHYWGGGGYLYGTFEGKWIHDGMGEWDLVNLDTGIVKVFGVWDTPDGVTVNGVTGKINVFYWATADAATGAFQGQWVIVSGTGDLANLRGHGTMWSTETDIESGIAWYTIDYHFGP